jgi:tRNA-uridine 2-sulfurtransferase
MRSSGPADRNRTPEDFAMGECVVVAMSGGVDSSVSAALLVDQGYDVVGVFLRLWRAANRAREAECSRDDSHDARCVADLLGIRFEVVDLAAEFRRRVVDEFVAEYRRGRTPNPCARCNPLVKFTALRERARVLGATHIATGHYARVRSGPGGVELVRAADDRRDQSYFLFGVPRDVFEHTLFPLGEWTKMAVRKEARRRGLPVAGRPDSQEICFLPHGEHADFVAAYQSLVPLRSGEVIDSWGRVLTRHEGVHRFTIGQRRGLGLGFGGAARYVTDIDGRSGAVRVGDRAELLSEGLMASGANWLGPTPRPGQRFLLKIRARFVPQPAVVVQADGEGFVVMASGGLCAVTPGQAAVLYDGDRVVGGGWIDRAARVE